MTFPHTLLGEAARRPDAIAANDPGGYWTYAGLWGATARVAVAPGSIVGGILLEHYA